MKRFLTSQLLFFCLFIIIFTGIANSKAWAQNRNCTSANVAPIPDRGWAPGATVPVYIDPSITGDRLKAVKEAINNWNFNKTANGSYVTLSITDQRPAKGTGYTILNQQHPTSTARATTDSFEDDNSGYTAYAITYLAPTVTTYDAVLETMSHEIGHPFGMAHCDTCEPNESVMATKKRYTNDDDVIGRVTIPTGCDNAQLYAINYPPPFCNQQEESACYTSGGIYDSANCRCNCPYGTNWNSTSGGCGSSGGGGSGGVGYNCYDVYEERIYRTCVDGDCGAWQYEYVYIGRYCYSTY